MLVFPDDVPNSTSEYLQLTGGTSISGGVIDVNAGSHYVDTKLTFMRPTDVTVKIRQNGGDSECGVISVFPQTTAQHSGYTAGIGWWGNEADSSGHFGAGVDGSISRYGDNNGKTSSWHTVRINVAADDKVYFYLDGELRHTVADNKYKSGIIRLGNSCHSYQYKILEVKQGKPTRESHATLLVESIHIPKQSGGPICSDGVG